MLGPDMIRFVFLAHAEHARKIIKSMLRIGVYAHIEHKL